MKILKNTGNKSVSTKKEKDLPEHSILCVVGARPNFMKIAPILAALRDVTNFVPSCLLHTGQHYDEAMKDSFFKQLGIPEPDIDLEVGSGTHSVQTAEIMRRFEPVVDAMSPVAVLVVGDVNSTIACALVAAKKNIPIIHVESGLRSMDRRMPEEINRVLTDQISDILFTTEASAKENLLKEGVEEDRIHFVGNVMIDTLLSNKKKSISYENTIKKYAGEDAVDAFRNGYSLLTMHRPSNVDEPAVLSSLVEVMLNISEKIPIVFTVHPRTLNMLTQSGLHEKICKSPNVICIPPVNYLEMLGLMSSATLVLTDSGGLQEETTALGIPCVTLRENTERPITVEQGTNTIVGNDPEKILFAVDEILQTGGKKGRVPKKWDGKAAIRIREYLIKWLKLEC